MPEQLFRVWYGIGERRRALIVRAADHEKARKYVEQALISKGVKSFSTGPVEQLPEEKTCTLCEEKSQDLLFVRNKGVCGQCFTELYIQSVARLGRLSEARYLASKEKSRRGVFN